MVIIVVRQCGVAGGRAEDHVALRGAQSCNTIAYTTKCSRSGKNGREKGRYCIHIILHTRVKMAIHSAQRAQRPCRHGLNMADTRSQYGAEVEIHTFEYSEWINVHVKGVYSFTAAGLICFNTSDIRRVKSQIPQFRRGDP